MKGITTSKESSAVTDGRSPWTPAKDPWVVFEYEVEQFGAMCKFFLEDGNDEYVKLSCHMRNAVVENALLHVRILADILLSRGKKDDDINLWRTGGGGKKRAKTSLTGADLLPCFRPPTLDKLRSAYYGKSCEEGTPCWTINKRLAHATLQRGPNYDYTELLKQLVPLLCSVVQEVIEERRMRG